jgi:hypothetical protein
MRNKNQATSYSTLIFVLGSIITMIVFGFLLSTLKFLTTAQSADAEISTSSGFHDCPDNSLVSCPDN